MMKVPFIENPSGMWPKSREHESRGGASVLDPLTATTAESTMSPATIGKNVKIVGQISTKQDLYVDGDVEGRIEAQEHKVTIGPNATLCAGINARELIILGSVRGNITAIDKIEIRSEAKLVGDVRTARILIEDGAYFKGSIDIVKPGASRPGLAAMGTSEAQAADDRAEEDIKNGRFTTLREGESLDDVLSSRSSPQHEPARLPVSSTGH